MAHEITQILRDWREGDKSAVDRLFPIVYDELKRQARFLMSKERGNHTLQPTALVNEAYMRLIGVNQMSWEDRAHFFAFSATTMRRILVEHARKVAAVKRGGEMRRLTLDNLQIADEQKAIDLLELDEAMINLAELDERKAKVVEMIFFGGLNQKEIAKILEVAEKTVQRDWKFAKLWLYRQLTRKTIPE